MSGAAARRLAGRLASELGVIVVGVWIALWADGWAADRRDQRAEAARLDALDDNVQATLAALRTEREEALQAMDALRTLIDSEPGSLPPDSTRLMFLVGFLYVADFTPEMNVYQDLRSSGELGLLSDAGLRQALSEMDASFEILVALQRDMETVQQLNVDPYLLERLDLRPFLGPGLGVPPPDGAGDVDLRFLATLEARNLALFKLDLASGIMDGLEEAEALTRGVAERLGRGPRQDSR